MAIKKLQVFWLILATLFVGGIIWFVDDSLVVTTISGTFTGIIGLFLGIDIKTMIQKTKNLKTAFNKKINTHRYVVALCAFAVLLAEAFIISALFGREMNSLYLCFGVGFLVMIGGLVGGIECDLLAIGEEGSENK